MRHFDSAFAIYGVLALCLIAGASAQCSITSDCNHTTEALAKPPVFNDREATVKWSPEAPGKYQFRFQSSDLCAGKSRDAFVNVRCPPPPIVMIQSSATASGNQVKQGSKVVLRSVGTTANTAAAPLVTFMPLTYTWSFRMVAGSLTIPKGFDSVGSTSSFDTPILTMNGAYEIVLSVSDGCSSTVAKTCFNVTCNCGPTAHAGAATTVWSNSGNDVTINVNNKNNLANIGNPFILDGSGSTDFDLIAGTNPNEALTYDWDFVSWEPAGPMPFATLRAKGADRDPFPAFAAHPNPRDGLTTWFKNNNNAVLATVSNFGYRVQFDGTALDKTYSFQRLPRLSQANQDTCSTETSPSCSFGRTSYVKNATTESDRSVPAAGYPKWVPDFVERCENFMSSYWPPANAPEMRPYSASDPTAGSNVDPTTTTNMGYIEQFRVETRLIESHTNVTTTAARNTGAIYSFCTIRITQASASDPMAQLYIINPDYVQRTRPTYLDSVQFGNGGFEMCRGLMLFQLTVQDACGTESQSVDFFRLTVRCNRPPVAIACCNTTVVYTTTTSGAGRGQFDQVSIDGRTSNDDDNIDLTYYWSFLSFPAAHADACRTQVGKACDQQYCKRVGQSDLRYFTYVNIGPQTGSPGSSFGNVSRLYGSAGQLSGVTAYDKSCAPNVYPPVYDILDTFPTGCTAPGTGVVAGATYCKYNTIANTGFHKGNSAYFTPTAPGTYEVQLAVFDGCSTTTDVTTIAAMCPSLTARTDISGRTGTFYPAGSAQVSTKFNLFSYVSYQGNTGALNYRWYYMQGGVERQDGFDNPSSANSTFSPRGSGNFNLALRLDDKCQQVDVAAVQVNVGCNAMPDRPSITVEPSTPTLTFNSATMSYPTVTITASANDADSDPLKYIWNITTNTKSGERKSITSGIVYGGGNTQNQIRFTPQIDRELDSRAVYYIGVYVNDGCQNSVSQSQAVTFECDSTLAVNVNPATPPKATYDFARGAFSDSQLTTAGSKLPYPTLTSFAWSVTSSGRRRQETPLMTMTATSGPIATGTADSFTFTPAAIGTYTVSLRVDDRCSMVNVQRTIVADCPSFPTASLALKNIATNAVEWDSYLYPYQGGFPRITLDAAASNPATGAGPRDALQYAFSKITQPANSKNGAAAQISATTNSAGFTPDVKGQYVYSLTVNNGPCVSDVKPTVTLTANCMSLNLNILNGQGQVVSAPAAVSFTSSWTGVGFSQVDIDATGLEYIKTDGGRGNGNFNALKYTWTVGASPTGSVWEASVESGIQFLPSETGWAYKASTSTTADTGNGTVTITPYTRTRRQIKTITQTTLFNHHYNKPLTAFRPDKPGDYSITLRAEDGCTDATMTATISASCNPYTVPAVDVKMANGAPFSGVLRLTGNSYQRVVMDARTTAPGQPCDTLSYEWTITSKPEGSTADLANGYGNIASIVPDKPGMYSVTFVVSDGCSAPKSSVISLTVECPGNDIVMENPVVTSSQSGVATDEIRFLDGSKTGNAQFGNSFFTLSGSSTTNCTVQSRRWVYVGRSCAQSYTPSSAPPTFAPIPADCPLEKTCQWKVLKFPCNYQSNQFFTNPLGCSGEGCNLETSASCGATFRCRSAGTYTLQLTMSDGCSTTSDTVPVVCKCANQISADVMSPQVVVLKTCDGASKTRMFPTMDILGSYTQIPQRAGAALPACPAAPAPAAATAAPVAPVATGQCCPAPAACPACTQCPQCAQCPFVPVAPAPAPMPVPGAAPGAVPAAPVPGAAPAPFVPVPGAIPGLAPAPVPGSVPAPAEVPAETPGSAPTVPAPIPGTAPTVPAPVPGSVPSAPRPTPGSTPVAPTVPGSVPAETPGSNNVFVSTDSEEEVSSSLLLGVIIPISLVMVGSVIGNVILFNKLRAVASPAAGGGDAAVSSSPTAVVVGRSV